jgi:hypothetical protein
MSKEIREILESLKEPMKLGDLENTLGGLVHQIQVDLEESAELSVKIARVIVGARNGNAMSAMATVMWSLVATASSEKFEGIYISENGLVYMKPKKGEGDAKR